MFPLKNLARKGLTHWGRVTHICVNKLTIIGSDNGLSPDRRQAIIWTNAGLLLIGPLGTNFSEILIEIITFPFKKMRLKVSSAKRRTFCLGLNVLRHVRDVTPLHWECSYSTLAWAHRYIVVTCFTVDTSHSYVPDVYAHPGHDVSSPGYSVQNRYDDDSTTRMKKNPPKMTGINSCAILSSIRPLAARLSWILLHIYYYICIWENLAHNLIYIHVYKE